MPSRSRNAVDFLTGRAPRPAARGGHAGARRRDAAVGRHRRVQPGRADARQRCAGRRPRGGDFRPHGGRARRPGRFRRERRDISAEGAGRACGRGAARRLCHRHRHARHRPCRRRARRRPHAARTTRSTMRSASPGCCRSARRSRRASRWRWSMPRKRMRQRRAAAAAIRAAYHDRRRRSRPAAESCASAASGARVARGATGPAAARRPRPGICQPLQEAHADQRAVERLVVEHHGLDVLDRDAADLQTVDRADGRAASRRWPS